MNKELENYILSQQMSTHEEERLGLPKTLALSKEQMLADWEEASKRQLTKDQQNQLLWEEEYKKRRAWQEEHWVETEGGDGFYSAKR